jgi:hypothetical protein
MSEIFDQLLKSLLDFIFNCEPVFTVVSSWTFTLYVVLPWLLGIESFVANHLYLYFFILIIVAVIMSNLIARFIFFLNSADNKDNKKKLNRGGFFERFLFLLSFYLFSILCWYGFYCVCLVLN